MDAFSSSAPSAIETNTPSCIKDYLALVAQEDELLRKLEEATDNEEQKEIQVELCYVCDQITGIELAIMDTEKVDSRDPEWDNLSVLTTDQFPQEALQLSGTRRKLFNVGHSERSASESREREWAAQLKFEKGKEMTQEEQLIAHKKKMTLKAIRKSRAKARAAIRNSRRLERERRLAGGKRQPKCSPIDTHAPKITSVHNRNWTEFTARRNGHTLTAPTDDWQSDDKVLQRLRNHRTKLEAKLARDIRAITPYDPDQDIIDDTSVPAGVSNRLEEQMRDAV